MKKLLLLSVLVIFTVGRMQAQITPNADKSKIKKTVTPSKIVEPVPTESKSSPPSTPPPPPPAPQAKNNPTTQEAPVYSLTAVRVKIRTGNDNKEFPSQVLVTLRAKSVPVSQWGPYAQLKLDNEMRINSDTEFGLEREAQLRGDASLNIFQSSGVLMTIHYLPNLLFDAWKIEGVSIVLEFKDQFGNLHPTLGNKTIVFSNAYGFLNNEYRFLDCVTDGAFAPLTSVIRK